MAVDHALGVTFSQGHHPDGYDDGSRWLSLDETLTRRTRTENIEERCIRGDIVFSCQPESQSAASFISLQNIHAKFSRFG